ncbi:hypothetical protein ACSSS7_004138 [Eimeria intestinalis]
MSGIQSLDPPTTPRQTRDPSVVGPQTRSCRAPHPPTCSFLRFREATMSHRMRLPFSAPVTLASCKPVITPPSRVSRFCERKLHVLLHSDTPTMSKLGCMQTFRGGLSSLLPPNAGTVGTCWFGSIRKFSSGAKGAKKDLYRLLGVSPTDGHRAIRAAYLRKAKELHPDANAHCPRRHHKEKLFREVTEAYQVLADPARRREYDASRALQESNESTMRRYSTDDWHLGRDEVAEELWRQVEQIRREKEMAWRTMKSQRQSEASSSSGVSGSGHMSSAYALLRALPLLLVPVILFYALYKSAMARAQNADRPLPPIVRDELGEKNPHSNDFQ